MKSAGLAGLRLRRPQRTTVADPAAVKAPDLLGRDFTASQVNTKYVGDITYLPVGGGKFRGPGRIQLIVATPLIAEVCDGTTGEADAAGANRCAAAMGRG